VPPEGEAVGAFGALGEISVVETLLVERARLLRAKVSERKKQLLIARIMAVGIRQLDVLISIRMLMGSS
jgi:hypothetical protein